MKHSLGAANPVEDTFVSFDSDDFTIWAIPNSELVGISATVLAHKLGREVVLLPEENAPTFVKKIAAKIVSKIPIIRDLGLDAALSFASGVLAVVFTVEKGRSTETLAVEVNDLVQRGELDIDEVRCSESGFAFSFEGQTFTVNFIDGTSTTVALQIALGKRTKSKKERDDLLYALILEVGIDRYNYLKEASHTHKKLKQFFDSIEEEKRQVAVLTFKTTEMREKVLDAFSREEDMSLAKLAPSSISVH